MPIVEIAAFIEILKNTLDGIKFFSDSSGKHKLELIEAHSAINTAYIETSSFLKGNHDGYLSNPELAQAWNIAASKVMIFDKNLGEILYYKSRFWNDPDLFIDLGKDNEIIDLNEIIEEMEKLRMKM